MNAIAVVRVVNNTNQRVIIVSRVTCHVRAIQAKLVVVGPQTRFMKLILLVGKRFFSKKAHFVYFEVSTLLIGIWGQIRIL